MTSEDTHDKHPHSPLHDHELEQKEVHEVVVFLRENGTSIAIAITIGVIASLGFIVYRNSQNQKQMYASQALTSAQSIDGLTAVARDFEGTPAALLAQLELAATQFGEGQYEQALQTYEDFITANPEHAMSDAAKICTALCREALGDNEQALSIAENFIAQNPDHFMIPMTVFMRARILAGTEGLDRARAVYEDFIAANPDSLWKTQAESALMDLNRRIRAGSDS